MSWCALFMRHYCNCSRRCCYCRCRCCCYRCPGCQLAESLCLDVYNWLSEYDVTRSALWPVSGTCSVMTCRRHGTAEMQRDETEYFVFRQIPAAKTGWISFRMMWRIQSCMFRRGATWRTSELLTFVQDSTELFQCMSLLFQIAFLKYLMGLNDNFCLLPPS